MKKRLFQQLTGFIKTPPLWTGKFFMGLEQFKVPEVQIPEDFDIEDQIPAITGNFVLGKRMENFLELIIKISGSHRFITGNLQISNEKITIGEIDFLVEDLLIKRNLHIEMVYKFYVYDPSIARELERWIGPNRKDSLLQKMKKLKNSQLPLIYKPETKRKLSAFDLSAENLEQAVCFKANLFIPRGFRAEQITVINPECIAGVYLHRSEFLAEEFSLYSFYSPKKIDWPVEPHYNETWYSFTEILLEINALLDQKRSPLIWVRKDEQTFERFFIVWW